jgi:hypothetical protein
MPLLHVAERWYNAVIPYTTCTLLTTLHNPSHVKIACTFYNVEYLLLLTQVVGGCVTTVMMYMLKHAMPR